VGIIGLIRDPRWSFVWFGWIYWGLMTLLPFLFPRSAKREFVLTIFTFGAVMAGLAQFMEGLKMLVSGGWNAPAP